MTSSPEVKLPVRIAGTASVAPGCAVPTVDLARQVRPPRDPGQVVARTGIVSRHFAEPEQTKAEVGAAALRQALAAAALPPERLERIIFVNSHGGDVLVPATANTVAAALGLHGSCDCFDLNNACMGFLSAFDLAARSIATGYGPVAVVASELGSRYITPDDPRPFLVCADAAAAVVLTEGRPDEGILGAWLRNDGTVQGEVTLAHPGLTGKRETIRFGAPSARMSELALEAVRQSADAVLAQAGLGLADVRWVLPHQPNGTMLAAMVDLLGLGPERVVPVVQEIGSVGAASLAVSLDRLIRTRPVQPGDRILMIGVGAGASYGALLHQVAP